MLKLFNISIAISIVITLGGFYLAQKNVSEKNFLRENGIETTADVTWIEELKGTGRYGNQNNAFKAHYRFKTIDGVSVNSYYFMTMHTYYNDFLKSPVNIFRKETPNKLDIIYVNQPPYVSGVKNEVMDTTDNYNPLKSVFLFFSASFLAIFFIGSLALWGKKRKKAKELTSMKDSF